MCDEYEQKLDRLKALDKKVEELKMKKGEFGLSGRSLTLQICIHTTCMRTHTHTHTLTVCLCVSKGTTVEVFLRSQE